MMLAYRVCKTRYAPNDTSGAARIGGRWNSPGRGVIYCGTSQAGAMLEILAHFNRIKLPGAHHVALYAIPDDIAITAIAPASVPDWDAPGMRESRAVGDAWLASRASAVLVVPSVIAQPYERNIVIDPTHPDFSRIAVHAPASVAWARGCSRGEAERAGPESARSQPGAGTDLDRRRRDFAPRAVVPNSCSPDPALTLL